jgi:hypothetical protein
MSHAGSRRDSRLCTRRDGWQRWLWRLVRRTQRLEDCREPKRQERVEHRNIDERMIEPDRDCGLNGVPRKRASCRHRTHGREIRKARHWFCELLRSLNQPMGGSKPKTTGNPVDRSEERPREEGGESECWRVTTPGARRYISSGCAHTGLDRLTSKMSHDRGWRAACRMTIRIPTFHFRIHEIARGVTAMVVGSGALLGYFIIIHWLFLAIPPALGFAEEVFNDEQKTQRTNPVDVVSKAADKS